MWGFGTRKRGWGVVSRCVGHQRERYPWTCCAKPPLNWTLMASALMLLNAAALRLG